MPRPGNDTARPLRDSAEGVPKKPRRRWWRWLLLLTFLAFLLDEMFTFISFDPPNCGHAFYETIDVQTREAYRAYLKSTIDAWGERYWEFEGGTLLRYDFEIFDDFGIGYDQMTRQTATIISRDVTIDGVEYPAPPYLDAVRRELAEKYGPDHDCLRGHFIASSCEMMAAVVLTTESYARYHAAQELPPLSSLLAVPQRHPE
jgi:hypothetical protein